ncbi:hypothetical protein [Pseudomonas silesiensis]
MSRKLEFWGAIGTIFYLSVISLIVAFRFKHFIDLELNELGDFLAGVFGPVAFLWLVLGFLQQGRELKIGSKALQLQAAELRRSVEQQSIIASSTLEQIQSQKAMFKLQAQEVARKLAATFSITGSGEIEHEGGLIHSAFIVKNVGKDAASVFMEFDPPIGINQDEWIDNVKKNGSVNFWLEFEKPEQSITGVCYIHYIRLDGEWTIVDFYYHLSTVGQYLVFEPTAPTAL